jgi:hypothetical protein
MSTRIPVRAPSFWAENIKQDLLNKNNSTSTLRLSVCLRTQNNRDHKRPKPTRFISKIISLLLRVLDSVYDAEDMLQIFLLSEFPVESCMLFTADYFTVFFPPIFSSFSVI